MRAKDFSNSQFVLYSPGDKYSTSISSEQNLRTEYALIKFDKNKADLHLNNVKILLPESENVKPKSKNDTLKTI